MRRSENLRSFEGMDPLDFGPGARQLAVDAELRAQISATLCEQATQLLGVWYSPESLRANFENRINGLLHRVEDWGLAQEYARYFPVAGATPALYRNVVVEHTEADLRIITGLRFLSLQLSTPFVEVAWQSRPLRDEAELLLLTRQIAHAYAAARPKFVQFRDRGAGAFDPLTSPTARADRYQVAGRIAEIAQGNGIAALGEVELVKVAPGNVYPGYVEDYTSFHQMHPELAAATPIETFDALADCAAEGTLFRILVRGAEAGVYALRRDTDDGLSGYCVVELLLNRAHRGKGFGPAVHVQACRLLNDTGSDTLFGSIGAENLPS